jgi:hypothetical protein
MTRRPSGCSSGPLPQNEHSTPSTSTHIALMVGVARTELRVVVASEGPASGSTRSSPVDESAPRTLLRSAHRPLTDVPAAPCEEVRAKYLQRRGAPIPLPGPAAHQLPSTRPGAATRSLTS